MQLKEIASAVVLTSPAWGVVVNAIIALFMAKNVVRGKKQSGVVLFIIVYIVALLLLAVWASTS